MALPHEKCLPELTCVETWQDVVVSGDLDEQQKMEIKKTLEEFSDVFSGRPNRTNAAVHKIDTGDAQPIRSAVYTVPQKLEAAVQDEINKMLEMNVIRPSQSYFSAYDE